MLQKSLMFCLLGVFFLAGFSNNSEPPRAGELNTNKMMEQQAGETMEGTIIQIIRIKSELPEEELLKIAREREPQFKAIPGLIQKYYIRLGSEGEYGGVYVWDSPESLKAYRESELAATSAKAYKVVAAPSVEIADILFQLRE
jgi:heme-degrading monooxygenase HmoA